eukprot:scaffold18711_cov36-Cyclotella_meneghiniana.AAC.4
MESCAACGKTDAGLKACAACKLVKYCNANCQIAHRSKHKKACRKKARELFDLKLFAHLPAREDCPICMLPLPFGIECTYMSCCGKQICNGCAFHLTQAVCPYCNAPQPRDTEEMIKRLLERIEKFNDANAMVNLGVFYKMGMNGLPIDHSKAAELFQRASELGSAEAHCNIGNLYHFGEGVKRDIKNAVKHWEIAAMMGNERSRHNLGVIEENDGNFDRAMKHLMISAKCGHDSSLQAVKEGFIMGRVTKTDFEITLRAHKASQDEMKSDHRDIVRRFKSEHDLCTTTNT